MVRKVPIEALYDRFFDELEIALLEALSLQSTLLSHYLSFAVFEPIHTGKVDPGYVKSREDASSFTCSPVSEVVSYWPAKARLAGKEKKCTAEQYMFAGAIID